MHRNTKTADSPIRLLRLTPIIFVLAGSVLTAVGNVASLTSCKIAGPVVITAGGLLLFFITFWNSRQDLPTAETTNCGEAASTRVPGESSNDEPGPIHHFEIKIPSESFGKEIIPPSYEEAVNNNDASLPTNKVEPSCDAQELNLDNTHSATPSYEESV